MKKSVKKYSAKVLLAMERAKTIFGTVFECAECKTRFIAGSLGMGPLKDRVVAHMVDRGHGMFYPINPKPGMWYISLPKFPYVKGEDPRKWYDIVVKNGGRMPKWELKVKA
jgi:hypothetical protein